jgi:hypothetical protein
VLAHDLAEAFTRLCGLQSDVEVDRGLDVLVPQHSTDPLVVPRIVLEHQGGGGMAELLSCQAKPCSLQHRIRDLLGEHRLCFVAAALAGENPQVVRTAEQDGSMFVNVLLD